MGRRRRRDETSQNHGEIGPRLLAATACCCWLAVVGVPVYFMLITSVRGQEEYLTKGPLAFPESLTLTNFRELQEIGFDQILLNSVYVTVLAVVLVLATALPASYAIARNPRGSPRVALSVALLGFAIPAQAVIVPIYFIITRLHLYDSLLAVVLPTAAFSVPISIIVLTSTLRDIPESLYEAMTVDGASAMRLFFRLSVPLSRPGIATVAIFSGMSAWNGFLFPLILTQSSTKRVIPLELFVFQTQSGINVPGLMAAVVLSALPVLVLYTVGHRQLLSGLVAGYGK